MNVILMVFISYIHEHETYLQIIFGLSLNFGSVTSDFSVYSCSETLPAHSRCSDLQVHTITKELQLKSQWHKHDTMKSNKISEYGKHDPKRKLTVHL